MDEPNAPRVHGAMRESTRAPDAWQWPNTNCIELPRVFESIAAEIAGDYANTSLLQLSAPNPGVELNVIGLFMSIFRYNMSVTALTVERTWLRGCEGHTRDRPSWLEVLAAYVPDLSSLQSRQASSMKARYLPDAIRVDFTGVRFTVSMRYDVYQFGVHSGSGTATITGAGTLWLDDISLHLADVGEDAVSMECGGDIVTEVVVFDGDYKFTEVLYMGGGIQRPDLIGYACDGFETRNYNPLASGWQWIGPGEHARGLRDRVAGFIHTACTNLTFIDHACGRCVLPRTWPAAALRLTTAAWSDDSIGLVLCALTVSYILLYLIHMRRV